MLGLLAWTRLEIGDAKWMEQIGWPLLFVVFLFVASLYLWSYISRTFDHIRGSEGKYVDRDVANFLEKMIKAIIIMVLVLWSAYVTSLIWDNFRNDIWNPFFEFIVDFIAIIFIFMVALLLVRILRRIALSTRIGPAGDEPQGQGVLQVSLLLLSYVVYVVAVAISLLIVVALVFKIEVYASTIDFLKLHGDVLLTVFIMIFAIYFVSKLAEEILEDYKFKTKKFNPHVIDLFKRAIKYVLWTIVLLTITYSLFALFNLQDIGLLLIGLFLTFIFFGLAMAYHTIRNIFSGLALMGPAMYEINDRIQVEEDLEGDVVQKNLMFTELRLIDGTFVNIPNARMIDSNIFNISRSGKQAVEVQFRVDFAISHVEVERLVEIAINRLEGLAKDAPKEVLADGIDGNKMVYIISVFADDPKNSSKVRSDLLKYVQEAFHSMGVEQLF